MKIKSRNMKMFFNPIDYMVDIDNTCFYKYRLINCNTLKSLHSKKVWFSSPATFNDPMDCKPPLTIGDSSDKYDEAIFNSDLSEFDTISSESAIYCLSSKKPTSELSHLMWSHYADSHKGICIEYKINKDSVYMISPDILENTSLPNKPLLMKVQYDIDMVPQNELYVLDLQVAMFGLKSKVWKYEHEYRIISSGHFEKLKGYEIEFPGIVTSITFGLSTAENDKQFIYNTFHNNIEFFEISRKQGSYNLLKNSYEPKIT